jgi:FlaA1/EpsC-like NDP-sugar epimerase
MSRPLMLQDKHAIVFGAGGSIGPAVAKELALQGDTPPTSASPLWPVDSSY